MPLQQAVEASGTALHPAWLLKGHHLMVTDGSTLIMPDTPAYQAVFPQQANQKLRRFPRMNVPKSRRIFVHFQGVKIGA